MKKILRQPLFLSLLIISLFTLLNFYGWLSVVENVFIGIFLPLEKAVYRISVKADNFVSFVLSIRELNDENRRLKGENEKILSELSQLKEVQRENEFLKKQLGLSFAEEKELVLAGVVGRESSGSGKYLLIDKGERDGIKERETVITAGNILVGRIIEVSGSSAKVRLITDPNTRVNVLISESGLIGLTENREGFGLLVDLLPQEETVEPGQLVMSSGLAGVFPGGLLIGRVEEVFSTDAQVSQRAKVKLAADFDILDRVFVIKE